MTDLADGFDHEISVRQEKGLTPVLKTSLLFVVMCSGVWFEDETNAPRNVYHATCCRHTITLYHTKLLCKLDMLEKYIRASTYIHANTSTVREDHHPRATETRLYSFVCEDC